MNIDCCKSYVGKQIIGLDGGGGSTPTQTCLYYVAIGDSMGPQCFSDPVWDFNGQGIDFSAAAAVYGGFANNTGATGFIPYGGDLCSNVTFSYIGTSTPTPIDVVDPLYGPYQAVFSGTLCDYGCLTTNSIELKNPYYGLIFGDSYINIAFTTYGITSIDFVNDLPNAESILNSIFVKFYPGSSVNVTANGFDYFTITFNNVYYLNSNLSFYLMDSLGINPLITTLVPC